MSVGLLQLLIILLITLLLFGAGKLPKAMSDLGKGIKSFRSSISDEHNTDSNPNENNGE